MAGEAVLNPVADIRDDLRRLQRVSGYNLPALSRRIGYSKSQLHAVHWGRERRAGLGRSVGADALRLDPIGAPRRQRASASR